jgi:tetratricopeptide (TPR) repeat protein
MNYLGYMLADRGDRLDEAIRLVTRALQADPDNGAYLDSLGWAHFKKGDLPEAEKYLSEAAERLPRNGEIQEHLGDVRAKRGQWQGAIDAWTRALQGDAVAVDREGIQKKIADARSKTRR